MKKIDKLILTDFIPPYIASFFVVQFVFIMQFMWKYIDDIIGKGVSIGIILELIFYFVISIISKTLPVTILIASVMVFGNLAERYELSSMKSAGISLWRIARVAIVISVLTAALSIFSSNYLKPRATLKHYQRMNAIKIAQPALSFEEGVFSDDFKNYVIRIDEIDKNGQDIEKILIYDHNTTDKSKLNVLLSKEGKMYADDDGKVFYMELGEGEQYRELKEKKPQKKERRFPLVRTKFKSWIKAFDMSQFDLEARNFSVSRKEFDLLSGRQLQESIDSFTVEIEKSSLTTNHNYNGFLEIEELKEESKPASKLPTAVQDAIDKKDKQVQQKNQPTAKPPVYELPKRKETVEDTVRSFYAQMVNNDMKKYIKAANNKASRQQEKITKSERHIRGYEHKQSRFKMRQHQIYSWALVCIIFLFIGAPLGSIVRKGGYGYPLLIAIIFFMLFIVMDIMGDKLNSSGAWGPVMSAWLPALVLLPFAVIISYMALNDMNFNFFKSFFIKIRGLFPNATSL